VFLRAAAGEAVRTMRALIVDDQASIRSVISKVLSRAGAACEMAGSGEEALEYLARAPYDMVLIDLALPGMDGLALARITAHRYPDVPMVMITGSAKFETAVAAMQAGAVDYVVKPFSAQTLTAAFERAASHRRVRLQAARAHSFHQAITERTLEIRMLLGQPGESADALAKGFVAALAMRSAGMADHVERVADLSRRIELEIGKPFLLEAGMARIGVSIGVAFAAPGQRDLDALLGKADQLMYEVKRDRKAARAGVR